MALTAQPLFQYHNPSLLTATPLYEETLSRAQGGFKEIIEEKAKGILPILDIVSQEDDIPFMVEKALSLRQAFKTVVILGTGGSSLGGQTLAALKQSPFKSSLCRVLFMDNIDPHTFHELTTNLNFSETAFIAISKSGTTAETLCQLLTIQPFYPPESLKKHVFILTEPKASPLRQIAEKYGLECWDHHTGVGGRFSVFTNVGLLPAAISGVDIKQVRQGAYYVLNHPASAIEGAALAATALHQGCTQTVVVPYIDRFIYLTFWFRQLWAESLGKQGQGTTPLNALGTVDQHSQLQLYLDGPKDKLFTLILLEDTTKHSSVQIPEGLQELSYLTGKTMNDLLIAEQKATATTLMNKGCPTRILTLSEVNEQVIGGLLMHYMLETMIMAKILGINAFDQPAVEEGKILTRTYLQNA